MSIGMELKSEMIEESFSKRKRYQVPLTPNRGKLHLSRQEFSQLKIRYLVSFIYFFNMYLLNDNYMLRTILDAELIAAKKTNFYSHRAYILVGGYRQ